MKVVIVSGTITENSMECGECIFKKESSYRDLLTILL